MIQTRPGTAQNAARRALAVGFAAAWLTALGILAEPGRGDDPEAGLPADAPADRAAVLDAVQQQFDPPVVRLPGEGAVVRSALLGRLAVSSGQRDTFAALLESHDVAVLNSDQSGQTLHYFAEGIEAMTPADRAWERLPRRARSLQGLVDHAITRARAQRRPIARLIITGHAGLPGACAFGGTLDDCAFDGQLTGYQRRQLRRMRPYLTPGAEIELRQCTTGWGEPGTRLLQAIHEATGAAASSYLGDFYFGHSGKRPRKRVDGDGATLIPPR